MEVRAVSKYVKVQPRKVRIIADEVRGMNAAYAAAKLRYHTSKSARELRKTLISAMANAVENNQLDANTLKIAAILVDQGPVQKRMQARAMGRGNRILKKTSHITVVVEDAEAAAVVKPHGTRPKARPTLAAKPGRGARPTATKAAAAPATESVNEEAEAQVENATPEVVEEAPVQTSATEAVAATEPTNEEALAESDGAAAEPAAPVTEGESEEKGS